MLKEMIETIFIIFFCFIYCLILNNCSVEYKAVVIKAPNVKP